MSSASVAAAPPAPPAENQAHRAVRWLPLKGLAFEMNKHVNETALWGPLLETRFSASARFNPFSPVDLLGVWPLSSPGTLGRISH